MKITMKECVSLAAAMLGLEELPSESFESGCSLTEQQQKTVDSLVMCANLIVSELAQEYMPLTFSERVNSSGFVPFSQLSKRLVNVVKVEKSGAKQSFRLRADGLKTVTGEVEITYCYLPESVSLSGELDFEKGRLSPRVAALGISAEYCLINGNYSEALLFDKRYKDSLLAVSQRKSLMLPLRRWA